MTDDYILTLLAAHAALGRGEAKTAAYLLDELRKKAAAAGRTKAEAAAGDETAARLAAASDDESAAGQHAAAEQLGNEALRKAAAAEEPGETLRQSNGTAETLEAIFRQNAAIPAGAAFRRVPSAAAGYTVLPARTAIGWEETFSGAERLSAAAVSDWFRRDARRYGGSGRL